MDEKEGRWYCKNFVANDVSCIFCLEQAIFKAKPCYKAGGR